MGIEISWRSQAGTRTKDNRDGGGMGFRGNEALCVVLDGSTRGPDGGALAQQIAHELIDWYVATDEQITAETLTGRLRQVHEEVSRKYPRDSASYMIVHVRNPDVILVLHAGDCLLGRWDEKSGIAWLSKPNTLANVTGEIPVAEIAGLPARHRLTRSFRAREFMLPDAMEMKVEEDSVLVVATDGFWAELSASQQAEFIDGHEVHTPAELDDRSVLCIRLRNNTEVTGVSGVQTETGNLYVNSA